MQIMNLVDTIRTPLTVKEKKTFSPLIVQGVHEREIISKLIENEIKHVSEFEWVSQLRFYIENGDVMCKCMQTIYPYGYEYMGISDRLVITPLTDKCYMTLLGAYK